MKTNLTTIVATIGLLTFGMATTSCTTQPTESRDTLRMGNPSKGQPRNRPPSIHAAPSSDRSAGSSDLRMGNPSKGMR